MWRSGNPLNGAVPGVVRVTFVSEWQKLNQVGTGRDFWNREKDDVNAGVLNDEVSEGLRSAMLHFRLCIHAVHRSIHGRWTQRDKPEELKPLAASDDIRTDGNEVPLLEPDFGLIVHFQVAARRTLPSFQNRGKWSYGRTAGYKE
jgi:hypothetical protein